MFKLLKSKTMMFLPVILILLSYLIMIPVTVVVVFIISKATDLLERFYSKS